MNKKIGLYFGTFNPIHVGHLIIANHMVENSDLDEIWMMVTPHNPFKKKSSLLDNHHRLEMVYLATQEYDKIKPSDFEFKLPQPNYTINTLTQLSEKYPDKTFNLIMGEDNLKSFHKWKNYEAILDDYHVYVYPRISEGVIETQFDNHQKIHPVKAPIVEISSTMIRNGVKEGKSVRPMLSNAVWKYVDDMSFYRK
ncbi:nicotinate-nucleotide adenylyltransferase [Tenacibaculum sp. MAR_2009_124]|uniref:nicotinate (nicotinamide) nucleotide adenylyltransferase n=1 Tax=Tenacibaculum sp. MAR_2009_124 TaxID=1250059 RepID=UPI00089C48F7|nr:nicotinate (nicotinamide) nucleotide adenylyltransferase [Tenacibaculum sp. MAR_2009_124]SEC17801.1 nicotinate-nucleotide adenylyltransferase [Tenacibaculum sp. MAR_2009_124]